MTTRGTHLLVGFDVNSSRARAVGSPLTGIPQSTPLEGEHEDLPLAVSLEGKSPEVGRPGLRLCRRAPHHACLAFLGHLGTPRTWTTDRHKLTAEQALDLVLRRLQLACPVKQGAVLAVPAYLAPEQVDLLAGVAVQAGLPVIGTIAAPLAAALAGHAEQPWTGTAAVIDLDDHALTVATLLARDEQAQVLETRVLPHLNGRAWKERLLAAVADRCIRQSRRDPRDSAVAEQTLYDGLEAVFEACRQGRMTELVIQTPQWYQNLVLQPEEVVRCCSGLVRAVVDALEAVRAATRPNQPPQLVLLTAAAGRLPGLVRALQECLAGLAESEEDDDPEDFGKHLLDEHEDEAPPVLVLSPDAVARAAQALARRFFRRELPEGHLDQRAPLPPPMPVDAGPARLQFQGQDFLLNRPSFTLGRQPTCDLVLDSDTYPTVSGRHCEIRLEQKKYVLRDHSRNGTLVNDRPVVQEVTLSPGDWIRLGPDGPRLRFLGQAADPRRLVTTA